jgi:hypothetical protein
MPIPRILHLSTELLPEREQFAAFREEIARKIIAIDVIDRSADARVST